jgi:hypothetical protein
MAKFSLARVPYYIAVAVYMGFVGVICWWNNTTSSGTESDVWLGLLVATAGLGLASVFYLFTAQHGDDDEVGVDIAGLQIGKPVYYLGVIAIAVWRAVEGYLINHNTTGIASNWGIIWLLSSLGILVFTYANYKSYQATHPAQRPGARSASGAQ